MNDLKDRIARNDYRLWGIFETIKHNRHQMDSGRWHVFRNRKLSRRNQELLDEAEYLVDINGAYRQEVLTTLRRMT